MIHDDMLDEFSALVESARRCSKTIKHDSRGYMLLSPPAKRWSKRYDNGPIPDDDSSFIRELRDAASPPENDDADHDHSNSKLEFSGVKLFVEQYEEDTIPYGLKAIIRYCKDATKLEIKNQHKASIWLDDRTHTAYFPRPTDPDSADIGLQRLNLVHKLQYAGPVSGANRVLRTDSSSVRYCPPSRRYPVPLTAQMLFKELNKKRYNHEHLPDSNRRLIFIQNPDPYDLLALIETVPRHQHKTLQDVIARYLDFRPYIRLKLSTNDIAIYRLSFHLPFFALRTSTYHRDHSTTKPRRKWIDLSFMANVLPKSDKEGELGIFPAQISIAICGVNAIDYITYGFEDTDFDGDRGFGEDESSASGFHADQIARGAIDANNPIWNPREYFLTVLKRRVRQIYHEWETVVRTIEAALEKRPSHSLNWCLAMLQVLHTCQLLPTLKRTISAWNEFYKSSGDVNYFSNSLPKDCAQKIENMRTKINQDFEEMQTLYEDLQRVDEECKAEQMSISAMTMEQSNQTANLMAMFLAPLGVVTSFFTIETPMMSLKRNMVSFLGINLLFMLIVQFLRWILPWSRYRPQWYVTLVTRRGRVMEDGPANTTKDAAGGTVIKRTNTYPWNRNST